MADSRGLSVGPGWLLRNADTFLAVLENQQCRVNGIAAGLTGAVVEEVVWCAPADVTLTAMYFTPSAASTIGTCTVINKGTAGSGTVALATLGTASVAAFTRKTLSMSTAAAGLEVDTGEYITFKRGTASATTCPAAGLVEIAYYMRNTKRDGS